MNNAQTQATDERKTFVNVSVLWHFIADYLGLLQNTGAMCDAGFCKYFKQLSNYVNGKIDIPQAKNILDEYVVYEVEI